MSLVLDSSATLAWIYSDEVTKAVNEAFDIVTASGAWAPGIWPLEVANSLQTAVRRGRIKANFRDATLVDLALLNIQIDHETNDYAWSTTLKLAHKYNLTSYDAAYLELAQRKNLPLASLDRDLRTAARSAHISLLGI
jgi:predicted nucleic acid-binding protein